MTLGDELIEQYTQYNGFAEAIDELEHNIEVSPHHPSGCYSYHGGSVWFNKHQNGSQNEVSAPICGIKGKFSQN